MKNRGSKWSSTSIFNPQYMLLREKNPTKTSCRQAADIHVGR
jgi:hypothetical protein